MHLRLNKRLVPQREVLALLNIRSENNNRNFVGDVVYINQSGMAFDYIVFKEPLEFHINNDCEVLIKGKCKPLISLPCRIRYDADSPSKSLIACIRRCDLEFLKPLSPRELESILSA